MALRRNAPLLAAGVIGVATGVYAFNEPLAQYWAGQNQAATQKGSEGKGKSVSEPKGPVSSPHSGVGSRNGGGGGTSTDSNPSGAITPTVAGTTESGRKSNSQDHSPALRKDGGKEQNGLGGGGMGVKEMRERKMEGRGLPSPQGGDTKAQPVAAQKGYAAPQEGATHR